MTKHGGVTAESRFATDASGLGGTFPRRSQESGRRNAPVMQPRHAVQIVNCPLTEGLKVARSLCLYSHMSTVLIEVRRAKPADATLVAATHDAAWGSGYRGMISGPAREKVVRGRGPGRRGAALGIGSAGAHCRCGDRAPRH